ncbi:hypothetical protein P7C70_g3521, partial [Phenoliferia sp. Uapishka_3]
MEAQAEAAALRMWWRDGEKVEGELRAWRAVELDAELCGAGSAGRRQRTGEASKRRRIGDQSTSSPQLVPVPERRLSFYESHGARIPTGTSNANRPATSKGKGKERMKRPIVDSDDEVESVQEEEEKAAREARLVLTINDEDDDERDRIVLTSEAEDEEGLIVWTSDAEDEGNLIILGSDEEEKAERMASKDRVVLESDDDNEDEEVARALAHRRHSKSESSDPLSVYEPDLNAAKAPGIEDDDIDLQIGPTHSHESPEIQSERPSERPRTSPSPSYIDSEERRLLTLVQDLLVRPNGPVDYDFVAASFPGTTPEELEKSFQSLQKVWRKALEPMDSEELSKLMSFPGVPKSNSEDALFDWKTIVANFEGVPAINLRQYWKNERKTMKKLRKSLSRGGSGAEYEGKEEACVNREKSAFNAMKDDYAKAVRNHSLKDVGTSQPLPATPIASTSRIPSSVIPPTLLGPASPSAPSPGVTASGRTRKNITYTRQELAFIVDRAPDPGDPERNDKWAMIADAVSGGRTGLQLAEYWARTPRNPRNKGELIPHALDDTENSVDLIIAVKRQSDAGLTLEIKHSPTQPHSRDPSAGPSDLKPVPPPAFVQPPPSTPALTDDNVEMEEASPPTPASPALLVIPEFALLDEAVAPPPPLPRPGPSNAGPSLPPPPSYVPPPAFYLTDSPSLPAPQRSTPWTESNDRLLKALVPPVQGKTGPYSFGERLWDWMATNFEGHSAEEVKERWEQIKDGGTQAKPSTLKRSRTVQEVEEWSTSEDALLRSLEETTDWETLATQIVYSGKSPNSLKKRWGVLKGQRERAARDEVGNGDSLGRVEEGVRAKTAPTRNKGKGRQIIPASDDDEDEDEWVARQDSVVLNFENEEEEESSSRKDCEASEFDDSNEDEEVAWLLSPQRLQNFPFAPPITSETALAEVIILNDIKPLIHPSPSS